MSAQITSKDNSLQLLSSISPMHQFDKLSKTSQSRLPDGWDLFKNTESVGTKDFIYCPCVQAEQSNVPFSHHMFILSRPNSADSVVLIRHSFLKELDFFVPHIPSPTIPHRLTETWEISNRLALFSLEAKSNYPGKNLLLQDLAKIITILLLRSLSNNEESPRAKRQTKDIGPAIDYIQTYYHMPITLEDLARQVSYSQYYFIRLFKKETGMSPFEFLTAYRLEKARELLTTTQLTITEICLQCGFQNSSHFATVFKQHTGLSPSEFRQSTSS